MSISSADERVIRCFYFENKQNQRAFYQYRHLYADEGVKKQKKKNNQMINTSLRSPTTPM